MAIKKITAYIIVFFLTLNLFSHVTGKAGVYAADPSVLSVVTELVSREDDASKKQLKVTYSISNYVEGTDVEVERSVEKDGTELQPESNTLTFTAAEYSEFFEEDGEYTITYKLTGETEAQQIEAVLDNEAPVVVVEDQEDGSIGITVSDAHIDENCCQLTYHRVAVDGFDVQETTGSLNLVLTQEDGNYTGTIFLTDMLKAQEGEGIYSQLEINATDQWGNVLNTPLDREIVIDETAPVVTVDIVDENNHPITEEPDEDGVEYLDDSAKKIVVRIADLQLQEPDCTLKTGKNSIAPEVNSSLEDNPYVKELVFSFDDSRTGIREGKFILNIRAEDLSGYTTSKRKTMIRDANAPAFRTTDPVLSYRNGDRLPAARRENGKDIYYLNKEAQVSFEVTEVNYSTAWVSIIENSQTADGFPCLMEGNPYSYGKRYGRDGSYHVYGTAQDKMGNIGKSRAVDFVIDTIDPVISISGIGNGDMTRAKVNLTFRAKDVNHDFREYKISVIRRNNSGLNEVKNYTYSQSEWESAGENLIKKELSLEKEGDYQVTFTVKDKAGNGSSKALHFYIDRKAPTISSLVYSDPSGAILPRYNNIYSNNRIALEFDLYDDVLGVANGVYVTLGTQQDRTAETPIYPAHRMLGEHYIVYIPTDMNLSEFNSPVTIWANDLLGNESSYTSTNVIYTTDYANIKMSCDTDYTKWTNQNVVFHTAIEDKKAGIDKIVYKVNNQVVKSVEFDKVIHTYEWDVIATESAEQVTGYTVQVEVTNNCGTTKTVSRRVFIDKDKPVVQLTGISNGTYYNQEQTFTTTVNDVSYENTVTRYVIKKTLEGHQEEIAAALFHSSNYESQNHLTMINEGIYEIYAVTQDSAGNTAISNTLQFVIDRTAPQLSITGVSDGTVSGQPVSLLFGCEEIYYDTNMVAIHVECQIDGQTKTYEIANFPNTGKYSDMSHTFAEDGSYVVTMSATDKAGNAADVQRISFTVDQTNPEIRIEGTTNYQLWNSSPSISFVVEESYYSTNQVTISGNRTDINGVVHEVQLSNFANSGKISRLNRIFTEDGIYDLVITSKDEAGNMSREEIHFTVDTTAPEIFLVDQFQGGYYHNFCLTDNMENVFRDLTVISYKILLNGVEYNGLDRITEEGKYNLYVEVTDELGHMSSAMAEFIIDHTAPKVIFSGIKDGQLVHEAGNISLSLTNAEDEITSVRMNGEELGAETRNISYTEYGSYEIDVDCVDKAGNNITRSVYFIYGKPIYYILVGAGAGAVIIIIGVWFFIRMKKRKEK